MKPKKIICLILSLLFVLPCLCLASCDSADVGDGDVGGLSTDETQKTEVNKNPYYSAPAKYKELAKSDKVYRSGIYTGYSIILGKPMMSADGINEIGSNLGEVLLDYPGEVDPVHEDPTCDHNSTRCPTSAESVDDIAVIVMQDNGLPIIFYFGIYREAVYSEEGEMINSKRVTEVRGYDVETGEYTTVSKIDITGVENAFLYRGRLYIVGNDGFKLGMADIVTGETKTIVGEDYYNEYNVLGIANDRLYYMHIFGEQQTEEHEIVKNNFTLNSCSLDLDDAKTEYDFGDLGNDYQRGAGELFFGSYMEGSMVYYPKDYDYTVDPDESSPDYRPFYRAGNLMVFDIYALDVNKISEGEKLILEDVYKYAMKDGKLYFTRVDYKVVGTVAFYESVKTFASSDGGTLYEYDIGTGAVREVCRDSGYNISEIYQVTDDGKLFFYGIDYVNYVPEDEFSVYILYCMLDLSTGEVTEILSSYDEGESADA